MVDCPSDERASRVMTPFLRLTIRRPVAGVSRLLERPVAGGSRTDTTSDPGPTRMTWVSPSAKGSRLRWKPPDERLSRNTPSTSAARPTPGMRQTTTKAMKKRSGIDTDFPLSINRRRTGWGFGVARSFQR